MKKTNFILLSLLALGLLISGCVPYPDDPNIVATNVALGTPPPPSYLNSDSKFFRYAYPIWG